MPPPPPPPPNPPPVPTYALPVTILAPLPLPVAGQQPGGGPNPPPPSPVTRVPLEFGGLPAVPVTLVQVMAPVPVYVLGGTLIGGGSSPPIPSPATPAPSAAPQIIGQITGAPGQLAGNIATLAAGGPPGAIAAAVLAIKDQIEQGLKATVQGIGETFRSVAALDPRALLEPINAFLEKIPLVGPALAETTRQFAIFTDAVNQTARRLSGFSPELAVTTAQTDVRQTFGDIRRAQQLGSGLARFTEAESRLSQTAQDIEADLLEQLLPVATQALVILNGILLVLEAAPGLTQSAIDAALAKLPGPLRNAIAAGTVVLGQDTAAALAPLAALLKKIEDNTRKKEPDTDVFTDELFGVSIPTAGFVPPPRVTGFTGG